MRALDPVGAKADNLAQVARETPGGAGPGDFRRGLLLFLGAVLSLENSGAFRFVPSPVPPEIRKLFARNALRAFGTRLRIWFFTE